MTTTTLMNDDRFYSLLLSSSFSIHKIELVVVTGASSDLGRKAALALLRLEDYHVIGAVWDDKKMEAVAEIDGFDLKH